MKKLLAILGFVVFLSPFAAWSMYKPVRVLAPEWVNNISCTNSKICIDDDSKYLEAYQLYADALNIVTEAVGQFKHEPHIVFCTTEDCFRSFGFNKASAITVGKSGIIISPRGWEAHYIRHEMIHHRQAEELGVFTSLFEPEWLIEGMAYSLSHDPRITLAERWQQTRSEFDGWFKGVGEDNLWDEARKL